MSYLYSTLQVLHEARTWAKVYPAQGLPVAWTTQGSPTKNESLWIQATTVHNNLLEIASAEADIANGGGASAIRRWLKRVAWWLDGELDTLFRAAEKQQVSVPGFESAVLGMHAGRRDLLAQARTLLEAPELVAVREEKDAQRADAKQEEAFNRRAAMARELVDQAWGSSDALSMQVESVWGAGFAKYLAEDEGMSAEQIRGFLDRLRASDPWLYERVFFQGGLITALHRRGMRGFDGTTLGEDGEPQEKYRGLNEGFWSGLVRTQAELGQTAPEAEGEQESTSLNDIAAFTAGYFTGVYGGALRALRDEITGLYQLVAALPQLYDLARNQIPALFTDASLRFAMGKMLAEQDAAEAERLSRLSPGEAGEEVGGWIGYIAVSIALTLVGVGAILVAAKTSKLGTKVASGVSRTLEPLVRSRVGAAVTLKASDLVVDLAVAYGALSRRIDLLAKRLSDAQSDLARRLRGAKKLVDEGEEAHRLGDVTTAKAHLDEATERLSRIEGEMGVEGTLVEQGARKAGRGLDEGAPAARAIDEGAPSTRGAEDSPPAARAIDEGAPAERTSGAHVRPGLPEHTPFDLERARIAAARGDAEEARRLYHKLAPDLDDVQAERLWRDLVDELGPTTLSPVRMKGDLHHLKQVDGQIWLCSDCAPLLPTLRFLRGRIKPDGEKSDKLAKLLATAESEAQKLTRMAKDGPLDEAATRRVQEVLEQIATDGDVACLSRLTDVIAAGRKANFDRAKHLEGLPLAQAQQDPLFLKHYVVTIDGQIKRNPGQAEDWPKLSRTEDGHVRFGSEGPAKLDLPTHDASGKALTLAQRREELARLSPAFKAYRDALIKAQIMDRTEIDAQLAQVLGRTKHGDNVDTIRHAFHQRTKAKVLDHCFDGADAATSHRRVLALADDMPPSYRGSLTERWYVEYRKRFPAEGEPPAALQAHPSMRKGDNPEMASDLRVPDHLDVRGKEIGEVKSTSKGLSTGEVARIKEQCEVILRQGYARVSRQGNVVDAELYRLTFVDPRGALGSVTDIERLLTKYDFLKIEVFDAGGVKHVLTSDSLVSMDLQVFLRSITP
ncbi:MAG: hypothetical protein EA397_00010 [Deltaproteobacteria bacterium]|nr:MAG: hypothetical protein EA397_00010 [Deltaproteobacteria bacterium]